MHADSFYVTAPSNASTNKYKDNNGGKFKFDLPETLYLSSDWEVGLAEITFRQDWNNIRRDDIWLRIDSKEFTDEEKQLLKNEIEFKKYWKDLLNLFPNMAFQFGKYEDHKKTGDLITIDWLDKDKPMALKDLVDKFNSEFKKAFKKAGWNNEPPFLVIHNRRDLIIPPENLPIVFMEYSTLARGVSFWEANEWREVNSKGIGKYSKRCLTFDDFRITPHLYMFFQALGVYSFSETKNGIPSFDSVEEVKKKSDVYKNLSLNFKFFPRYIISSTPKKYVRPNLIDTTKKILAFWPREKRKEIYLYNDPNRQYKKGTEIFINKDSVIHSEVDLTREVWGMIKKAAGENHVKTTFAEGVWIETKVVDKTQLKTIMSFTISNVISWRLELSHALSNLLGIGINQLNMNTFIIPTSFLNNGIITKPSTLNNDIMKIGYGYDLNELEIKLDKFISRNDADLTRNISTLWIYTDICEPTIVGDSKASLIRTVPVKKNARGQTCLYTYDRPYYFPLRRHTIADMEFSIYDTYGRAPINFSSHVVCQLHIRRKKKKAEEVILAKKIKLDDSI